MRFTAYKLSIESELALPELPLCSQAASAPDVTIRFAQVPPDGLPEGKQLGPFLWATSEQLWLKVPSVARFCVRGGHSIIIDPEPGIDADSLRVFLLGSVLGALLFQRGHLVLHGNAIRIGDKAMICVGKSGAGKSTLAAGFMQRGYDILADDVVPVDALYRALPGFPRIKLWKDVADKLNIDVLPLKRIRPGIEKYSYPLPALDMEPLPIRWIYILQGEDTHTFKTDPIHGMQRLLSLHANTYRVKYLDGMGLKAEHLRLCAQLGGRIRLARVSRPKQGFELDGLIDHLLADMGANP